MTNRITTKEAALILFGDEGTGPGDATAAVLMMRAAGVPEVRCGGTFLWDVRDVEELKAALDVLGRNAKARAEESMASLVAYAATDVRSRSEADRAGG